MTADWVELTPTRWEYLTMELGVWVHGAANEAGAGAKVAAMGADGWELVGFPSPYFAVFKRRLSQQGCDGDQHRWLKSGADGSAECHCGLLRLQPVAA